MDKVIKRGVTWYQQKTEGKLSIDAISYHIGSEVWFGPNFPGLVGNQVNNQLFINYEPITHESLVKTLVKPGQAILDTLTPRKVLLWEAVVDGMIRASKLFDAVKKAVIYNDPNGIDKFTDIWIKNSGLITMTDKQSEICFNSLTAEKVESLHYASALAGEAGELSECILDYAINNNPLDIENLTEELGDKEFYSEALRQLHGISYDETRLHNIAKLSVRYAGKYSDQAAKERVDKKEEGLTDNKFKKAVEIFDKQPKL